MLQKSSEHFSWLKKYPSGTLAQILKEPLLLQKQILIHMKAPSLSSQVPDRQGPGINLGAPFPFSLKSILSRKIGCGTPMMMPDIVKQAEAWGFIYEVLFVMGNFNLPACLAWIFFESKCPAVQNCSEAILTPSTLS